MLILLVSLLCVSPSLLWKSSKRPGARQRRPNLKILAQELMRSGRTRADGLDRVMPKPFLRLPSYDPEAGDSPTGSATFVKANGSLPSRIQFRWRRKRVAACQPPSVRQLQRRASRRMRVLKRAGSDTELDVAGGKTATNSSGSDALQALDVSDFAF
jgi:hypothetical protein